MKTYSAYAAAKGTDRVALVIVEEETSKAMVFDSSFEVQAMGSYSWEQLQDAVSLAVLLTSGREPFYTCEAEDLEGALSMVVSMARLALERSDG